MKTVALLCLLHAMFLQPSSQYGWNGPNATTTTSAPGAACDIDPHSCACCAMVQEVKEMEEHFNTVLTELENEYQEVNQSFHIINSSRVAFSASLYQDDRLICEDSDSDNHIIKYKHVFLNLLGAYSNSTGIFTAPFAGLYSVAVTVYSDSGSSTFKLNACASLQVNGAVIASASDRNKYDHEDSATIVVALHLQVEDEVSVRLTADCVLCDDGRYNTFSVFLLHATG